VKKLDLQEYESANYFDQSIMDYKHGSSRMRDRLPEVAQGYFNFTDACFKTGAIDQKQKQLTALAISICTQNEYCIMYHTKAAVDAGASEAEFMEMVAVSAALGGGAAFAQGVTLAMDTFDHYQHPAH